MAHYDLVLRPKLIEFPRIIHTEARKFDSQSCSQDNSQLHYRIILRKNPSGTEIVASICDLTLHYIYYKKTSGMLLVLTFD